MTDTPRGYPVPAPTDVVSLDAVQDLADAIDADVTTVAAGAGSALASHEADTTSVHGIANTALLVKTSDTGTVATSMIADSAITSAKIADGTIVTVDLADSAVTSAKIADGTIGTGDLADSAVTTAKIAAGAVVTVDLADSAVTSAKIADGTIVNADINATAAIAATKIAGTALVATIVDAKGDLIVGTAADTATRIAVGADGSRLVANSATTEGMVWKPGTGLMVTENVATGTDTLGTTAGYSFTSATGASSTDRAVTGSRSLKLTLTAVAGRAFFGGTATSGTIPVVPGEPYHAEVTASSPSGTATRVRVLIYWWTAAGNVAASTALTAGTDADLTDAWATYTVDAVAPADAAFACVVLNRFTGAAIDDVRYEDHHSFWRGAGGIRPQWGSPVAHTGIRTDPANSAQVQIWNPGNSTWITV